MNNIQDNTLVVKLLTEHDNKIDTLTEKIIKVETLVDTMSTNIKSSNDNIQELVNAIYKDPNKSLTSRVEKLENDYKSKQEYQKTGKWWLNFAAAVLMWAGQICWFVYSYFKPPLHK